MSEETKTPDWADGWETGYAQGTQEAVDAAQQTIDDLRAEVERLTRAERLRLAVEAATNV